MKSLSFMRASTRRLAVVLAGAGLLGAVVLQPGSPATAAGASSFSQPTIGFPSPAAFPRPCGYTGPCGL